MTKSKYKTVYLVRHGQSEANVSPVYQSPESPLSAAGLRQADVIAQRLTHVEFQALLASPYPRAHQTADAIAKATGVPIELNDVFTERRKPNGIDGKPHTDQEAGKQYTQWVNSLHGNGDKVGSGESFDDIVARADAALKLFTERPEQGIVVATHGYFLRVIVARVLIGDALTPQILKRFQERSDVQNTGITVLRYHDTFEEDHQWRLWTLNDHSHFAD